MNYNSVINDAVSFIHGNEEKRKSLAQKLFPLKELSLKEIGSNGFHEEMLFSRVEPAVLEGGIAGVDSGFVAKLLLI
jgi:hypothetical protein